MSDMISKALDIGCGKGVLASLLSPQSILVDAVDLSPVMIDEAKLLFGNNTKLNFICEDINALSLLDDSYDFIVSTDVVHHLDFVWFCDYVKQLLKPQGKLVILDFYQNDTLSDCISDIFSTCMNVIFNLRYNHKVSEYSKEDRLIWKKHENNDTFLTLSTIRELASRHLPNASIKRKLFWRYILVWEKAREG
jgi:2-polyprenyl-3-methyl-5-hydroxy-6-metoxy-1,4-benzoquinol methylase